MQQIEIYIGDLVQHQSEQATLSRLIKLLESPQQSAIIFANVSIRGHQIDAIVATERQVLVIEAKGFHRSIKGNTNGPWQVRLASGQWKEFRNPYVQARDAALALRDAMLAFTGSHAPYPGAAVVFVPAIPMRSDPFSGDFKVSVIGLDGLKDLFKTAQVGAWPIHRWRAFATHLGLSPVSSLATACDRSLAEAEALLRQYSAAYGHTYADPVSVVSFPCQVDESLMPSDDVVVWAAEGRTDILLEGPSGCGKTILANQAGCAFTARGGVAVTLPIKDYAGSLKNLLDREIGLLIGQPAKNVLSAARRANRPLLFIIDGYNECAPSEQASLSRGLAALARLYEANLLITSQRGITRGGLLPLRRIKVAPATLETKAAIALSAMGGGSLPPQLNQLLDMITTGLEARLVGELGRDLFPGASRYALFDLFARKRLGAAATDGITFLTRLAGWLTERIAFSLSRRDLDRLLHLHEVPYVLVERLYAAGLLTQRGERVSFVHELFLDAFAAEQVLRQAAGNPEIVLQALAAPRNGGRKTMIIGAIDDDTLLAPVLAGLTDSAAVTSCLEGACGVSAQTWAKRQCGVLWKRLQHEAAGVRFRMNEKAWNGVEFDETSLESWAPPERAFLAAMPVWVVEGNHLDEALETIATLDRRIVKETDRLRREAGKSQIALKSGIFAIAYVGQSVATLGITRICAALHGGLFRTASTTVAQTIQQRLTAGNLSPGQLYFLLELSRGTSIAARLVAAVIRTHWPTAPYHLRLELLDAVNMSRPENDDDRTVLVTALEALPPSRHIFISSMIVEALQGLGALEDSEREHITNVREQVEECLAHPKDPDRQALAYSLHSAQFDHPYAGAYCGVIAELPASEQKALFTMAAKGADNTAFFLGPLLMKLASFGDPEVGGAISRWTALPPKDCIMPQDAIAVFVISHIILARLGHPLPDLSGNVDETPMQALRACGVILYWCNRADLDESTKRQGCETALRILTGEAFSTALDVIRHCEHALVEGMHQLPGDAPIERSILSQFPAEVTDICRRALYEPDTQTGYFQLYSHFDRRDDLALAMDVLARYGDGSDLALMKGYADDAELGQQAIKSVKTLEERLTSS